MADENEARHVLAEMQARLARSAYDALGIQGGNAGPEVVRAAFFELAKSYHPQKFARMSSDIQKMANEVFLALRAAHDQLARPKTAGIRQGSGVFPALAKPADFNRAPPSAVATRPGSAPPARTPPPVNPANQPPAPTAAISPGTVRGVPPAGTTQPIPRPTAPAKPGRPPLQSTQMRKMTPAGGVPVPPPTAARPAAAAPKAPAGASAEPELVGVYELLQKGEWNAARTTLNALIALQPKPRYRALLQYSIGREAQLARRLDEARVDLQGALEIDPDLQVAKTALAELFTRRR